MLGIIWLNSLGQLHGGEADLVLDPSKVTLSNHASIGSGKTPPNTTGSGEHQLELSTGQGLKSARNRRANPTRVVLQGLAVVLGGYLLLVAVTRKRSRTTSPDHELLETLGSAQVTPRVRLHLVRLGKRLLLLHITPQRVDRVAEVTDPQEVMEMLSMWSTNDNRELSPPMSNSRVEDLLRQIQATPLEMDPRYHG